MDHRQDPSPQPKVSTFLDNEQSSSIAAELERMVNISVDVFNTRSFGYDSTDDEKELRSRVSPNFQGFSEDAQDGFSWDGFVNIARSYVAFEPGVQFEVRAMHTDVSPNGTAVVYQELKMNGVKNVSLPRFVRYKWRKIMGKWMWYKFTSFAGSTDRL